MQQTKYNSKIKDREETNSFCLFFRIQAYRIYPYLKPPTIQVLVKLPGLLSGKLEDTRSLGGTAGAGTCGGDGDGGGACAPPVVSGDSTTSSTFGPSLTL